MANTKEIKDRINSIQETQKITNAMYLISSTKLRKARRDLEATEPYFYGVQRMMERLQRHLPDIHNLYLGTKEEVPEEERITGFLVVTADKGLAGSYNRDVLKLTEEEMGKYPHTRLFVVGEIGRQYFESRGIKIDETFHYTAQNPSLHRARMITARVLDEYQTGRLHNLIVIYTEMVNSMTVQPVMKQLLPFLPPPIPEGAKAVMQDVLNEEFVLYPSAKAVINNVVPNFIQGLIYSALVESFCSEQNARMMAMQTANDSAGDLLHDLSIEYNRVRQAAITQEITEVSSGARASAAARKARQERREAEMRAAAHKEVIDK